MWVVNLLVALAVVVASSIARAVRRRRHEPNVSYHSLGRCEISSGSIWRPRVGVVVVVTSPKLARPLVRVTDETGWYTLPQLAPGGYNITHVFPDGSPTTTEPRRVDEDGRWVWLRAPSTTT
jgi:hypothetical protein